MPKRIGVLGHYGNVNLGDEASFAATIQNIYSRYPDAEVTGFTLYPKSTTQRHGVPAVAIRRSASLAGWTTSDPSQAALQADSGNLSAIQRVRRVLKKIPIVAPTVRFLRSLFVARGEFIAEVGFLWSSLNKLKRIDVLWIAGSNQLEDAHGAWGYPYTLFKWTQLARLAGTKVLFVSVGASPMSSKSSRLFTKRALATAKYLSFRSVNSKLVAEQLGIKGSLLVYPDLAASLDTGVKPSELRPVLSSVMIGINPMGYFDRRYWPEADDMKYRRYLEKLAEFASWLVQSGHKVMFFPTQLAADPPVIDDILAIISKRKIDYRAAITCSGSIQTCDDLLNEMNRCDITVVTRFHGVVLSHLLYKPTIAVSYEQKIDDAMASVGHEAYCVPIADFDVELLKNKFAAMLENRAALSSQLANSMSALKVQLSEQYDHLLSNY